MDSENIVVTGFGPFGEHKINASWEAVKLLKDFSFPPNVNIIVEEIPVTYNYIEEKIPQLWETYKPKLVVHVGVSSYTDKFTIESRAFRTGYDKLDCELKKHSTGEICSSESGTNCIQTKLDANKICEQINSDDKLKACVSTDAGRYLCEYIYYKSLNVNDDRTLFVHVPPLGQPYDAKELADGVAKIVLCALEQVEQECKCTN